MLEKQLVSVIKPQSVDLIPKKITGKVGDIIAQKDENKKS
jgi:translation initiation factor RLI1